MKRTGQEFRGQDTVGLVPDPGTEDGRFLRDDGTWANPLGVENLESKFARKNVTESMAYFLS